MFRLELSGADTRLGSTLCARCPQGAAGCCASPPAVAWADLGRIVAHGGAGWLLEEIASGRLRAGGRGLLIRRVAPATGEGARCAYHGPAGCTIAPGRRSATCNYYLCDDGFEEAGEGRGDPDAARGREAHEALTALYGRWDIELGERVRGRWPEGPPWDAAFLTWLGEEHRRQVGRARRALRRLSP